MWDKKIALMVLSSRYALQTPCHCHPLVHAGFSRLERSQSLEALLWLSLTGVSTGDCCEAFQALLGLKAPGLSPATISRLKQGWHEELTQGQSRRLQGKRYILTSPIRDFSEHSCAFHTYAP